VSIRNSLLALLLEGRAYGNQLRTDFEERTGGSWPLNIGQVYQTLDRLVRDGLVVAEDVRLADVPAQARSLYRITDAGQAEVLRWFAEPVARGAAPRDELTIKLAVAMCSPRADVGRIIDGQGAATMHALQELTTIKRRQFAGDPTRRREPWMLILDRMIFDTEAELRWLEHCRSTLHRDLETLTEGGPST
jgi:DNA-binding PadR family transcriptional regulator